MKFEFLMLISVFSCSIYLFYLVTKLKSLVTPPKVPTEKYCSLNRQNIIELQGKREELLLDKTVQLLARAEDYELHFEHATKEEILNFDLEFRFERRKVLNSLRNIGYFEKAKRING
ncbi:hypothetical protein [Pseudoalteromonas phenolica]|uniref:hypothetical protein n=1 Tax=Pseudoalteromonas phenolica TaxID=161398 RepID=UPI00110A8D95|nr:hypothetical protein [Pseudoalteromonas phenolica]TMO54111.1 hypothetical protein CWC21_16630 [Pseudoalteromonas phenolica]